MQSIIKKVVWISLCVVPFIALYVADGKGVDFLNWGTPGMYFPFISGKNMLFRTLVEIAFAGWAILALHDSKYRINFKKSPLAIAYAVFVVVLLVADILGVDPSKSMLSNYERMEGFIAHIHFFAYFLVLIAMLQDLKHWQTMWKVFLAGNFAVLIWAYGQLLGAQGYIFREYLPTIGAWFSERFPIHLSDTRLDATIGNSAYFAIFCLMNAFIAALLWSQSKENDRNKRHWVYPTLIVLNLIALFYSGTRGTIIGLVVAALLGLGLYVFKLADSKNETIAVVLSTVLYLVYSAISLFFNNDWLQVFQTISYAYAFILLASSISILVRFEEKYRRIGAGIFIGIIAVIFLFQAIKTTELVASSPTLARIASISPRDITTGSRLAIWQISFEAWKERPILGYGQDNFSYIYARKFIPEKMWNLEAWYDRSHDVFFDWLVAGGILGLLSYLSLYFVALYLMWRRKNEMSFREKAILTGVIAGYFVHNIFVFDNMTSYILFFALLAYISTRTKENHDIHHKGFSISEEQINLLYAPAIGILLVVAFYYVNYKPFLVDKYLIQGMDINRLIQKMPFAEAVKVQEDSFVKAIGLNTLGSEETREQFLQMGVRLAQVNIPQDISEADRKASLDAVQSFIKAVRDDIDASLPTHKEDVRMLSIYGTFYNGTGDPVSAEKILYLAHTLAPKKQLISFDLIRAYLMQNKMGEAYSLATETYDDQPIYPTAAKWYALAAVYAGKWNEARAHMLEKGQIMPFDQDVLKALVDTKQIGLAIQLLNEFKKTNPEYSAQIDNYIKQLIGGKK